MNEPLKWIPVYQICVRGRLDPQRSAWFEGMEISPLGEDTLLTGALQDSSALYGILEHLRNLGLELVYVVPLGKTIQNP